MAKNRTPLPLSDVPGNIRRGIKAIGDPIPPPSVRELTRDPFSELTRRERRALLIFSILGIVVGKIGIMPMKIESVGIAFNADQHTVVLYLLAAVTAYFLCAFLCYSTLDYVASWEAREADRVNELDEQAKTKGFVALPYAPTPPLLVFTRRFRAVLDFWLPTALSVWAMFEIIARARHL